MGSQISWKFKTVTWTDLSAPTVTDGGLAIKKASETSKRLPVKAVIARHLLWNGLKVPL
jgi:hypothetical protein